MNLVSPALLGLLAACGARTEHPSSPAPPASSIDRFVDVLKKGNSLYGLGAGCDEWRAQPDGTEPEWLEGSFEAPADREGRVYVFEYQVHLAKAPLRVKLTGRGGWHPAEGVIIPGPDGNAIIGVGSYCISEVDVRADPEVQDAVFVGTESWFFTHDACVRSKRIGQGLQHSPQGCSK